MGFKICLVTAQEEGWYPALGMLCEELGIELYQRQYDSYRYSMDREYIEKLPAFHVIEDGHHKQTLYPGPDILEVERLVTLYRKKQFQRKNKPWRRLVSKLLKI